jgi:TRAP-type mannitol/chloroaromatic compound transport system permease small subunit
MAEYDSTAREIPPRLRRTIKTLDAISDRSGRLIAWLVIPLMAVLVFEVISRYVFDKPTLWAFDFTYMLYGAHFMLVSAFTLFKHGHIRTDFLYRTWSPRWQGTVDATLYLVLFLPAVSFFFWFSLEFAYESWVQKETSFLSPWQPPIYPLKIALPISAVLLFLQGIAEFLRSLYAAKHGSWHDL